MTMHRSFLVALGLFLVLAAWYFFKNAKLTNQTPPPQELKVEDVTSNVDAVIPSTTEKEVLPIPPRTAQVKTPANDTSTQLEANPYSSLKPVDVEFEVNGDLAIFQGDIVLGKVKDSSGQKTGRFSPDSPGLWESSTIPFSIDEKLPAKERVLSAIEYLNRETALKFRPYQGEKDSLVFTPRKGPCASYLGRMGGHQPIYLDDDCGQQEILHEILHALGFVHEHARTDRDRHIEVLWHNIKPEHWPQFAIVPDRLVHSYTGSVFDFDHRSIMLYEPTIFAISPNQPSLRSMGRSQIEPVKNGLSDIDKERIYYLYGR